MCECAAGLVDLGNGLCCNANRDENTGQCAQELQRRETLLEVCRVNENTGNNWKKNLKMDYFKYLIRKTDAILMKRNIHN